MRPLIYIICCLCAISSYAQNFDETTKATFTLNEFALLDLEPNNATVSLNVIAPNEAGKAAVVEMVNNIKWINFSSAVIAGHTRDISIVLDGEVPSGIDLKLRIEKVTGEDHGMLGKVLSQNQDGIILDNNELIIIDGIGGAFTGDGETGYKLTYSLVISNYEKLDLDQTATLSISLTLKDY